MNTLMTIRISLLSAAACLVPAALSAQSTGPENLIPEPKEIVSEPVEVEDDAVAATPVEQAIDAMAEPDFPETQVWSIENARALAAIVEGIGAEGLYPEDYNLSGLRQAIAIGPDGGLNDVASESFQFLVEDLRDGRTPMKGRKQWFVLDPDVDRYPTDKLMADAVESGDIAGVLARIMPEHPDYFRLKDELANTPTTDMNRRKLIIANMDRWRWLARDLGSQYLMTNVPEYQLRLTVNDKIIRTYRTVVGKPGRTATPQIAESVEGVIFNPTWTVPQSIVKGEGLGARVLGNPAWARAKGYKASKGANGWVSVVQQPGPTNSLGLMKLDMPNRHAIFFHDTPSRHLFKNASRALSHGCIRTERATELAITLAILQGGLTGDEAAAVLKTGKYTKIGFGKTMPAYITYFTMAQDINGELRTFRDIYGRDKAVLDSFENPRVPNRSRVTGEQVIPIENDPRDIV
ncbi:L,D-transpeptidase family protein [Pontixanthobacter sp. CEM42]|uniref:L,D-transpeptidase family protein n=1 Tax=Pontixanthobacter sp. CEM42 TaxID=2792077 RepID=UPI0032AE8794